MRNILSVCLFTLPYLCSMGKVKKINKTLSTTESEVLQMILIIFQKSCIHPLGNWTLVPKCYCSLGGQAIGPECLLALGFNSRGSEYNKNYPLHLKSSS